MTGLKVHVDGARIQCRGGTDCDVKDPERLTPYLLPFKGLACPFRPCGANRSFIKKCRKIRQMVGGGMRQAGFVAAAGIMALNKMVDRLAEDHANARLLAAGLRYGARCQMPTRSRQHSIPECGEDENGRIGLC